MTSTDRLGRDKVVGLGIAAIASIAVLVDAVGLAALRSAWAAGAPGEPALRRAGFIMALGAVADVLLAAIVLAVTSRRVLRRLERVVKEAEIADGAPQLSDPMPTEVVDVIDAVEAALEQARGQTLASHRFLSDAAHQLRAPVTTISASAELLASGVREEDSDRLLRTLVSECARMGRLVTGLVRMASLEQGDMSPSHPTDVVPLCAEEVERVAALCPELDVALQVAHPSPPPIELDPLSMQEALSNLLENARRHAIERVVVSVTSNDDELEVAVADDGHGLAPDDADRAFERFATLDACGGSGLGLPIARAIVEAHGGTLRFESGAFRIRLPRQPALR